MKINKNNKHKKEEKKEENKLKGYQPIESYYCEKTLEEELEKIGLHTSTEVKEMQRMKGIINKAGDFHSLVLLDDITRDKSFPFFNLASQVYRATSSVDGGFYCLRKLDNPVPLSKFSPLSLQTNSVFQVWKDLSHPSIIPFFDLFVSSQDSNDCNFIFILFLFYFIYFILFFLFTILLYLIFHIFKK